jgi:hypothetical protein
VASCRKGVDVFLLFNNDVWFKGKFVRNLGPKKWYGTSNLYKRGHHRCHIIVTRVISTHYLLNFNKICRSAFLVNTTAQISSPCKVSTSSCYKKKGKSVSSVFEILKINKAVDDRDNPFLPFKNLVHLLN